MKGKHVIVSDGREIKVYQVRSELHEQNKRITLDLLTDFSNSEGHQKLSEMYSDRMGDFKDSTMHGGGTSEPKVNLELEKKFIKHISDSINDIMNSNDSEIYFSAPESILKRVQSGFSDNIQKRIKKSLPKNLVGLPKENVLSEFGLT